MTGHKTRLIISALTIFCFSGCSLSEKELQKGWWKYADGYHVEDVLDFKKGYSISGDTLLQNGQKIGIIASRTRSIFGDNKIEISSLDKKQSGVYYQK